MNKFQPGDRLRVVRPRNGLAAGSEHVVRRAFLSPLDSPMVSLVGKNGDYYENRFEKVESDPAPKIAEDLRAYAKALRKRAKALDKAAALVEEVAK